MSRGRLVAQRVDAAAGSPPPTGSGWPRRSPRCSTRAAGRACSRAAGSPCSTTPRCAPTRAVARLDPELESLTNVNTPAEYAAARARPPALVVVEAPGLAAPCGPRRSPKRAPARPSSSTASRWPRIPCSRSWRATPSSCDELRGDRGSSPMTTVQPLAGRREWVGLGVVTLACLLYVMDLTVLHVAIPQISEDLHPSGTQLLWIIDGYGFTVAGDPGHDGHARRPHRTATAADGRRRGVRRGVAHRGVRHERRDADRERGCCSASRARRSRPPRCR